jgi:HEAT repeat protein
MAHPLRARKGYVPPGVSRTGPMALFRTGKPNVKALAKRGDEDGLVAAAGYQDLIPAPDGSMVDRGAALRKEAILALGALGPDIGTEAVLAALSDPADNVRVAAVRVLFAHRAAVPLASALAWLRADHGHSRALAIRALLELRVPECAPSLAVALVNATGEAPVGDDEAALLQLLVHAAPGADTAADAVEELLIALADERDPVADRAEELLVLIAPVSTEGVIAELKAGAAPHRAAAVLAQIKDTRALEPLMEGLLHRDARVRAECAGALGELHDPAAVEALIHASRDPEHRVRAQAGWALDRLGMIALVVGVSTMIRPMILEAVAGQEARPALTEAQDGSSGDNGDGDGGTRDGDNGNGTTTPDRITPEALQRLLSGTGTPPVTRKEPR